MLFEHFPYTNFHNMNLDWIIKTVQNAISSIAEYESSIDSRLELQDSKIEQYKQEVEEIAEQYKNIVENKISDSDKLLRELYTKTLDIYNKTLLQVDTMKQYVDSAVSDFGSIAQWSIVDDKLVATVFNGGVLISVGMTADGRMEVITNE